MEIVLQTGSDSARSFRFYNSRITAVLLTCIFFSFLSLYAYSHSSPAKPESYESEEHIFTLEPAENESNFVPSESPTPSDTENSGAIPEALLPSSKAAAVPAPQTPEPEQTLILEEVQVLLTPEVPDQTVDMDRPIVPEMVPDIEDTETLEPPPVSFCIRFHGNGGIPDITEADL